MVLNCTAFLGREGTFVPVLVRLPLLGNGAHCIMVPGVIILGAAHLTYQHQCGYLLAKCTSNRGPKPAADTQLLIGSTDSMENHLVEGYASAKFGLYFCHLFFDWNNSVMNLSLVWSIFSLLAFFFSLYFHKRLSNPKPHTKGNSAVKNTLFPLSLIKRHYAIGL